MAFVDSFKGHGTFILGSTPTVAEYGSIDLLGSAMDQCGITHAWVRIHGDGYDFEHDRRYGNTNLREIVAGLRGRGIHVAGWGWCQGADTREEARLALSALSKLGLNDYVADIEEGV